MLLHRLRSFLRYIFTASNAHGIHSPFIYELYTQVIAINKKYYAFAQLKKYRENLSQNHAPVQLIDLGAGKKTSQALKVSTVYRRSCHSEKDTQLLFKLVDHFKPQTILELGTCLGVSTLYLAKAAPHAKIFTFEGNPDYAQLARKAFKEYQLPTISLVEGNIHQTLEPTIAGLDSVDFVFIDAHHAYEPTLRFFSACLAKAHEQTVIVMDDIYWSAEMTRAWETIKGMDEVKQTIDLFQFGLVFFKNSQAKENFVLRYF